MKTKLTILLALLAFWFSGAWAQVTSIEDGYYLIYNPYGGQYLSSDLKSVYNATGSASIFKIETVDAEKSLYKIYSVVEGKYLKWSSSAKNTTSPYNQIELTNVAGDISSDNCKWAIVTDIVDASGNTTGTAGRWDICPKGQNKAGGTSCIFYSSSNANLDLILWDNHNNMATWQFKKVDIPTNQKVIIYSPSTGSYSSKNAQGTYATVWESTELSPKLTITAYSKNMDVANGNIYMGNYAVTSTNFTLSVPVGYVITGYAIIGHGIKDNQTITPSSGGEAKTFTSSTTDMVTAKGLTSNSAIFRIGSTNNGFAVSCFLITVAEENDVDGVVVNSIKDNGCYTIELSGTNYSIASSFRTSSKEKMLIRVENSGEKETISETDYPLYYLYSVMDNKYIKSTSTLSTSSSISLAFASDKEHASTFTIRPTSTSTIFKIYPNTSSFLLTAWNNNVPGHQVVNYSGENNATLSIWKFRVSSITSVIDDFVTANDPQEKLDLAGSIGYPKKEKTSYTNLNNLLATGLTYTVAGYNDLKSKYYAYRDETDIVIPPTGFYKIYHPINQDNANKKYFSLPDLNNTTPNTTRLNVTKSPSSSSSTIFYYDSGKHFLSYNNGLFVTQNGGQAKVDAVDGTGTIYTFKKSAYTDWVYYYKGFGLMNIKPDGDSELYDDNSVSDYNVNKWSGGAQEGSTFLVEPITSLPVNITSIGGHGFASFYTPVAISSLPEGVKAYIATIDKSASRIRFTNITDIPAGTAVIIYKPTCTENTTVNLTIGSASSSTEGNVLRGNAATVARNSQNVMTMQIVNENLGFYKYTGTNLSGFKAYIDINDIPSNVKSFVFDFDDDDATGIASLLEKAGEETAIYNLAGQRLNKMQKGINIVNGKKVLK